MHADLTIFYADDDAEDRDFFREATSTINGIQLFTHDHGKALLDALENPPPSPHIIFLDLNMPGKNSFEILRELKSTQRFKEIPVVIFSTSADEKNISQSLEMGASFYLPKLENYESYIKSIHHTLSIDWQNFKPTRENFLYTAA